MAASWAGRLLHISAARGLSNRNWPPPGPRRRRLPYTPGDAANDARDECAPLTNPPICSSRGPKSLELDTPYVPPPGDPLEHHAAGFAKVMCSAVFVTGLDPDFAAEHVGYFTAPYEERAQLGKPVIDRAARAVHVTLPNGVRRTAVHLGDQGCVTLPRGHDAPELHAGPGREHDCPDAATQPWPMGDVLPEEPLPAALDMATVKRAVDAAFEPAAAMTAAFVVTWKGRVIAERYGDGHHAAARRSRAGRWARA